MDLLMACCCVVMIVIPSMFLLTLISIVILTRVISTITNIYIRWFPELGVPPNHPF